MDNLTHSLTGLALSRAGLNRFCPHSGFLLILAANVPDIDMVSLFEGPLRNLEIHRGYTHSLLCLPLMALIPVAITAAATRRRLPWLAAWLISCIAVASHLLLDWSMSYGIRLLLPFSSRWFHLDIFSLVDWILLAVLVLAWTGPLLGRLVSEEIGDHKTGGRGLAIFALLFLLFYGGFRAVMHQRVIAALESRIYNDFLHGPVKHMAAFPQSMNPLAWSAIVAGENADLRYDVLAYADFDPATGELFYQAPWNAMLQKVSKTEAFRYYLYFMRFPYWEVKPGLDGTEAIILTDLRFGRPGESFLVVRALVNANGEIKVVGFGR